MATATESKHVDECKGEDSLSELHTLQDCWAYYLFIFKKGEDWSKCIEEVATFETIEHFWSVLAHTVFPSDMINGNDLYMFKRGIKPVWEDPINANGGRWLINLTPDDDVDTLWEELLMLMIGCDWETDTDAEHICGAVYQPRTRGHRMSLWVADASDHATLLRIGSRVKSRLNLKKKLFFHSVEEQKAIPRGKDITSGTLEI